MKQAFDLSGNWRRLAVIADIHSNVEALDATLADIASQNCDGIIDLGDCVSGPLYPRESAARLMALGIESVRGNHERQVTTLDRSDMGASDAFADAELTPEQKVWLAARPARLEVKGEILAIHGTPASDLEYLMETIEPAGSRPATADEIDARLAGVPHRLILCAHSHLQRSMRLSDGRLVVNPGSIGLPAYEEQHAVSKIMHKHESGSPHARYAIITHDGAGYDVTFRTVVYDWDAAAALAAKRNRHEWAVVLRSGRAELPA